MRAQEQIVATAIAATGSNFVLQGGYYCWMLAGGTPASGNHYDLTMVGPDGSTAIVMIKGDNGTVASPVYAYLPPGAYKFTLTGTLTTNITLTRVPLE